MIDKIKGLKQELENFKIETSEDLETFRLRYKGKINRIAQ